MNELISKRKSIIKLSWGNFSAQILYLGIGIFYCMEHGGLKACPEIGKRAEVTFAGMTATVLALITNIGTGRTPPK